MKGVAIALLLFSAGTVHAGSDCAGVSNPRYLSVRPVSLNRAPHRRVEARIGDQTVYYDKAELLIDLCSVEIGSAHVEAVPSGFAVIVALNEKGRRLLGDWTATHIGAQIGLFVNGRLLSAPRTNSRIDTIILLDDFASRVEAERVAATIRRGGVLAR